MLNVHLHTPSSASSHASHFFGLDMIGPLVHDRVTAFRNKAAGVAARPASDSSQGKLNNHHLHSFSELKVRQADPSAELMVMEEVKKVG